MRGGSVAGLCGRDALAMSISCASAEGLQWLHKPARSSSADRGPRSWELVPEGLLAMFGGSFPTFPLLLAPPSNIRLLADGKEC